MATLRCFFTFVLIFSEVIFSHRDAVILSSSFVNMMLHLGSTVFIYCSSMFAFYRIYQAYDFIHISLLLSWLNIVWCSGNDYGCSKSSAIQ